MACLSFINATNPAAQILLANGLVTFTNIMAEGDCYTFNGTSFTLPCAGYYKVSFDADIDATVTGEISMQILNNGVAVAGGIGTVDATAGSPDHLHIQGVVKVLCSCKCVTNEAIIQIQTVNAASISNPSIIIEKI